MNNCHRSTESLELFVGCRCDDEVVESFIVLLTLTCAFVLSPDTDFEPCFFDVDFRLFTSIEPFSVTFNLPRPEPSLFTVTYGFPVFDPRLGGLATPTAPPLTENSVSNFCASWRATKNLS